MIQSTIGKRAVFAAILIFVSAFSSQSARAECTGKVKGTPSMAELKKMAKVSMKEARATAVKLVGQEMIQKATGGELEVEEGCLVYSFDLRLRSGDGVEEVMVDAVSGAIISRKHESPAEEAAEKAADQASPSK
jgi:uncharacterized membrane protein YkoI